MSAAISQLASAPHYLCKKTLYSCYSARERGALRRLAHKDQPRSFTTSKHLIGAETDGWNLINRGAIADGGEGVKRCGKKLIKSSNEGN